MSQAAERIRADLLRRRAERALTLASKLGADVRAILDSGDDPPDVLVAEFEDAYGRAETLMLEHAVARPSAPSVSSADP